MEERSAVKRVYVALSTGAAECRSLPRMHLRHRSLQRRERVDAIRRQCRHRREAVDHLDQFAACINGGLDIGTVHRETVDHLFEAEMGHAVGAGAAACCAQGGEDRVGAAARAQVARGDVRRSSRQASQTADVLVRRASPCAGR